MRRGSVGADIPEIDDMVPQSQARTSCDSVKRRNLTRGSHVKGEDDARSGAFLRWTSFGCGRGVVSHEGVSCRPRR